MLDILKTEKSFILQHIKEGDTVADFTMGNGHDTEFLSKTVGAGGKVTAFDIQPMALESTAKNLRDWGCPENWRLICDSHHNAPKYIEGKIKAGMFNLGYLPGSGNKALTTMRETTLPAVENALSLLDRDAILMVAVYPGHPEGALEGEELQRYFATLSRYKLCIAKFQMVNSPTSPYFMIAETK